MDYTAKGLLSEGFGTATVHLGRADRLLDPNSTKGRYIYGPARVSVTRHRDGGIDVIVADLPASDARR